MNAENKIGPSGDAGRLVIPVIVGSQPWADAIPGWLYQRALKNAQERLMAEQDPPEIRVSLHEVTCYFFTASLAAPLSSKDAKLYLYCSTQVMEEKGAEVPDGVRVGQLSDYEQSQLDHLRFKLGDKQRSLFASENRGLAKKLKTLRTQEKEGPAVEQLLMPLIMKGT